MSVTLPAPIALVARAAVATLGLGAVAAPALAESPQPRQFADSIESFGVVRHTIAAVPGSTWAVSMDVEQGRAQMFVSTEPGFRPHDADCAGASTCTVTVADASELYVFVLAESDVSYGVIATPTDVAASR